MPGLAKRPLSLARRWRYSIDAPIAAIAPAPDGSLLAVAPIEGPITVLDTLRGEAVCTLAGNSGSTVALDWTPDAALLLSMGHDDLARLWDSHTGTERLTVQTGAQWGERIVASPDNARIATAAGRATAFWYMRGQSADRPSSTSRGDAAANALASPPSRSDQSGFTIPRSGQKLHANCAGRARRSSSPGVPTARFSLPVIRMRASIFGTSRTGKI